MLIIQSSRSKVILLYIYNHALPALLSLLFVFPASMHCPLMLSTSLNPLLGRISQDISSFLYVSGY